MRAVGAAAGTVVPAARAIPADAMPVSLDACREIPDDKAFDELMLPSLMQEAEMA